MSLHINEYLTTTRGIPYEPALAHQDVAAGGTSKPFGPQTAFATLYADEDCDADFGSGPLRMRAGERITVGVTAGGIVKVKTAPKVDHGDGAGATLEALLRLITDPEASRVRLQELVDHEARKTAETEKLKIQHAETGAALAELEGRETALKTHTAEVVAHEEALAAQVAAFEEHAAVVEKDLAARAASLTVQEEAAIAQRVELDKKITEARQAQRAFETRSRDLDSRESELKTLAKKTSDREAKVFEREQRIADRIERMRELAE